MKVTNKTTTMRTTIILAVMAMSFTTHAQTQCEAVTKAGTQCKRMTEGQFCWQHEPPEPDVVIAEDCMYLVDTKTVEGVWKVYTLRGNCGAMKTITVKTTDNLEVGDPVELITKKL